MAGAAARAAVEFRCSSVAPPPAAVCAAAGALVCDRVAGSPRARMLRAVAGTTGAAAGGARTTGAEASSAGFAPQIASRLASLRGVLADRVFSTLPVVRAARGSLDKYRHELSTSERSLLLPSSPEPLITRPRATRFIMQMIYSTPCTPHRSRAAHYTSSSLQTLSILK